MTKVRTHHGFFLTLLCVLALLVTPTAAVAQDGQEGNLRCPSGTETFTINNNPGNGTFGDGTVSVTITNSDSDSFNWTSNRSLHSVLVKGGPKTTVNPGGTSGFAESAFNPNSGQNYGISHVTFCYRISPASPTPTPTPTPTRTPTPTPTPTPTSTPTPPCDADLTMPGIQPCESDTELCPPGTDFAGVPMDQVESCNRDDVAGEVITKPLEVCPSGPFKGMPFTDPRDCLVADRVLPNVIRNQAGPGVEAAPAETSAGAALPFTGGGAGSVLPLLIIGLTMVGAGTAALRTRRKR